MPAIAGGNVQAARTMTSFAAHFFGVLAFGLQTRMRGGAEIAYDISMTGVTRFGTDKFRAGNGGWRNDRAIRVEVAAGKENNGQRERCP